MLIRWNSKFYICPERGQSKQESENGGAKQGEVMSQFLKLATTYHEFGKSTLASFLYYYNLLNRIIQSKQL